MTAALVRSAGNLIAAYSDAIEWFPKELEKNDGVHELREIMKQVTVTVVGKAKRSHVQKLLAEEEETPARTYLLAVLCDDHVVHLMLSLRCFARISRQGAGAKTQACPSQQSR